MGKTLKRLLGASSALFGVFLLCVTPAFSADFDDAFDILLKFEGGYVDNPDDGGGPTKYGISQRSYPDIDIESLTKEEAKEIYRKDYWEVCCLYLSWPLSLVVFDTSVLMGPASSREILELTSDWRDYLETRHNILTQVGKDYPEFAEGWLNRTRHLYELIQGFSKDCRRI